MAGNQIAEIRTQLTAMSPEIAKVLPEHVTVERFERITMTAIQRNPELAACERKSLFESVMQCAQDGLIPDGREAALTKFGNSVAYMPMVAGILKKVRQSGEISTITAQVVYDSDEFDYWIDDDGEHMKHKPDLFADRSKAPQGVKAVYAMAKTNDGAVYIEVASASDIEKVRNASKAKNGGPWRDWWSEMARKTVYRRLAKRLPMSTDIEQVIHRDDQFYDMDRKRTGERSNIADAFKDEPKDITPKYADIASGINNAKSADEANEWLDLARALPEDQQAEMNNIWSIKIQEFDGE